MDLGDVRSHLEARDNEVKVRDRKETFYKVDTRSVLFNIALLGPHAQAARPREEPQAAAEQRAAQAGEHAKDARAGKQGDRGAQKGPQGKIGLE